MLIRHANNQKYQSRKSVVEPVTALIKSPTLASANFVIETEMGTVHCTFNQVRDFPT